MIERTSIRGLRSPMTVFALAEEPPTARENKPFRRLPLPTIARYCRPTMLTTSGAYCPLPLKCLSS